MEQTPEMAQAASPSSCLGWRPRAVPDLHAPFLDCVLLFPITPGKCPEWPGAPRTPVPDWLRPPLPSKSDLEGVCGLRLATVVSSLTSVSGSGQPCPAMPEPGLAHSWLTLPTETLRALGHGQPPEQSSMEVRSLCFSCLVTWCLGTLGLEAGDVCCPENPRGHQLPFRWPWHSGLGNP